MANPVITLLDLPHLLSFIPSHDREVWVNVGMGLKSEFGDAARPAWEDWSATDASFKKRDASDVWRSVKAGRTGINKVIKYAKDHGWSPAADMTAEERRHRREEQAERRREREAVIEADEAQREVMRDVVAAACQKIWAYQAFSTGTSAYLERKGVAACGKGIGYMERTVLLWIDDKEQKAGIATGATVMEFFRRLPNPRPDHISFLRISRGSIVIPVRDEAGKVWALQAISNADKDNKRFPKYGRKKGCWHMIGDAEGSEVIAFAEGYATAASIHLATGWAVVVAFTNENMPAVGNSVRSLYPGKRFVFCADRDANGSGEAYARKAASHVGRAVVVLPVFEEAA